jgi:hypothetical protein
MILFRQCDHFNDKDSIFNQIQKKPSREEIFQISCLVGNIFWLDFRLPSSSSYDGYAFGLELAPPDLILFL